MTRQAKFDFADKAVLVTGGSSGIGWEIARAFGKAGASVAITGTRESAVQYTQSLEELAFHSLDLLDGDAILALAKTLKRLDILVNAAGMAVRDAEAYQPENFERNVAVNLHGTFRMSMAVLPLLEASRGVVLNIASMTSYFAAPGTPGYGASKAGVVGLTQSLGVAWAPKGIRVNAIAPGWIETKLTDYWRINGRDRQIMERTPMARWGRPEEMAGAALFLCSDAASFITGATLPVDGGYSAR